MQERDFKGVWFPKEVWLNKELDMIEKGLLLEIDSLDNEFHCIAGNEYFAEFLGVSESKITRSIKKLKDLGYIEEIGFDGRIRKLRVVNLTRQTKQIDDHNNITINNNKTNTNVLVTENSVTDGFLSSSIKETKPKEKKSNLYTNCLNAINEFTDNQEVRDILREYLKVRLENKTKPIGINSFKGSLKKLRTLTDSGTECIQIIQQAIDRQYLTFYPLSKAYNKKSVCPELIESSEKIYVSDDEYEEAINSGEKF